MVHINSGRKCGVLSEWTWYKERQHWFDAIKEAIAEGKRINGGSRKKKEALINGMNPEWRDFVW